MSIEEAQSDWPDSESRAMQRLNDQLTAAQQRVAELEQQNMRLKEICESSRIHFCQHITERLTADNQRLTARVAELDEALRAAVVRGLESEKRVSELEAKLAKHKENLLDHKSVIEDKRERNRLLTANNERLRGLLRDFAEEALWALPELSPLRDRIKAELGDNK